MPATEILLFTAEQEVAPTPPPTGTAPRKTLLGVGT